MLRISIVRITCVLTFAWAISVARADEITDVFDEFDNPFVVGAVQDRDAVKKFRKELDKLEESLHGKNQRDIEQLLGKPRAMLQRTYAMPVAQARTVSLPGLRPVGSKGHQEFFPIKDAGGLEVWYIDDAPLLVVVRLKVDKNFAALTDKNLKQRLAWDREKFDKLVKYVEEREKEVNKEKKK